MRKKGILLVWMLLTGSLLAHSQYREGDWELRDQWMDVPQLFNWAGLEEGNKVADVGCHEGYLSIRLSKAVGDKGQVWSVDVREDRLETLRSNAMDREITNIKTVKGDYDDPRLPGNSLDVVFVIDTYHEIKEYMTVLSHIKNALKPGGRIVVLEKLKNHAKNKSRSEQASSHTLAPAYVRKELTKAGFKIIREERNIGDWENETDKKMWVLVAKV